MCNRVCCCLARLDLESRILGLRTDSHMPEPTEKKVKARSTKSSSTWMQQHYGFDDTDTQAESYHPRLCVV
jgi:hypothetical protein